MKNAIKFGILFAIPFTFAFTCGYGIGLQKSRASEVTAQAVRNVSGTATAQQGHRYPVEQVLRVIDGDTLDVRFAIWEDIVLSKRVRVIGVDTPELRPRKGTPEERTAEKEAAKAALEYVKGITSKAKAVYVVTDWESDSFGRVLARIEYDDESGTHDLSAALLESGHAQPYVE